MLKFKGSVNEKLDIVLTSLSKRLVSRKFRRTARDQLLAMVFSMKKIAFSLLSQQASIIVLR